MFLNIRCIIILNHILFLLICFGRHSTADDNINNNNNNNNVTILYSNYSSNITNEITANDKSKILLSLNQPQSSSRRSYVVATDQKKIERSFFNLTSATYTTSTTTKRTSFYTKPTTATTTTTTTTSTTTTVKKIEAEAFIIDFKLIDIVKKINMISIDFLIQTNISSINTNRNNNNKEIYVKNGGVSVNIDLKCSNDFNQTWSKFIPQIFINSPIYNSRLFITTKDMEPKNGSLIKCKAIAFNALNSQNQNLTQTINLLNNPLPATSFIMRTFNETSIELKWSNPLHQYNNLDVVCFLNESFIIPDQNYEQFFNETIQNDKWMNLMTVSIVQSKTLNNLAPGANYNCTLITKRIEAFKNDISNTIYYFSQTPSNTLNQYTKLGKPSLVSKFNNIIDSIVEIDVLPPLGYYDYYTIELKEIKPIYNSKQHDLPNVVKNFTFDLNNSREMQKVKITNGLKPGYKYEIWSKIVRFAYNHMITAKLGDTFIIRPKRLNNFDIYVQSPTQINLKLIDEVDITKIDTQKYLIEVYTNNQPKPRTLITYNTTVTIDNLNNLNTYLISLKKCAKLNNDCDILSESINKTFNFNTSHLIYDFELKRLNSSQINNDYTSLLLKWKLNSTNICDLGRFRITYSNLKTESKQEECYSDLTLINSPVKCLINRNSFYLNKCISSTSNDNIECTLDSTSQIYTCQYMISKLSFNALYKFKLNALSLNNQYEWPISLVQLMRTESSVPSTQIQTRSINEINSKLQSSSLISIIQPFVDQSNGPVFKTYLYLVKLKSNITTNETSILSNSNFDLTSTFRDQTYLQNLIESSSDCSNMTSEMEPCILKTYNSNEIDLNTERLVFIGQLMDSIDKFLMDLNLTYQIDLNNYENITYDYIQPLSLYQLFYVFKIENINSQANDEILFDKRNFVELHQTNDYIFYSTLPTRPIQTKKYVSNTIASLITRDGLAMWLIVIISIISSLILILIIFAIIGLLVRYKPSKFHKASQMVTTHQQRLNMNSMSMNRGKFDFTGFGGAYTNGKHDLDYLGGMNSEFIIPGEFGRYQMTNIWLVKHANGDLILDEEYRNLPDYRDLKSSYASQLPKNEIKNRFLDIKAYDDSRVLLDVPQSNNTMKKNHENNTSSQNSVDKSILTSSMSTSTTSNNSQDLELMQNGYYMTDYINANFIQGYSHDKKFIATQGPKKETIPDFWRMIYQYRITAIVMLTKLVEKGVERCTQYWPDKLNITEQYGDFEITMKDQQKCGDYIKRSFDLIYVGTALHPTTSTHTTTTITSNLTSTPGSFSISNRRILNVTQYYYPEWPDKDTPSTDPISILHLIRDVNQNHLTYQYPIVVHCSAGVGRTGTYITLDAMMEKIELESKIDIFGFISKIRERRQYLVQTSKQYVFIHEALYEYCLYGFTDIELANLVSHFKYLKEISPVNSQGMPVQSTSNKTRLQIEYDKLSNAFVPNIQAREAFSNDNKSRNRNLNTICYDENRVRLSTLNGSSYINATKIKGYELNNELIITQDPMSNTKFEFWKMIVEYECNVIVCLNKDYELEEENVYWPTLDNPVQICEVDDLRYVIELVKSTSNNDETLNKFIKRQEFDITEYKYSSSSKVRVVQFMFNEQWMEGRAPKCRREFIDLVCKVQKAISNNENSRIAVHANGGGSNCSVFCALTILLNQFRNDQRVDVCRTVKTLKTQRPNMIETYEQYEFLYECLLDFIEMFGIYNNNQSTVSLNSSFNDSLYRKSPLKHI